MMSAHIYLFPDLKVSVNTNVGKDTKTGITVESDTCTTLYEHHAANIEKTTI